MVRVKRDNYVYCRNNLEVLRRLDSGSVDLVYIDPPFNTGKKRKLHKNEFDDYRIEYVERFLKPRLKEMYRIMKSSATLYFHIDQREVAHCRLCLDDLFIYKNSFLNEVIWAYDYGGRSKKRWPNKHNTILVYVKDINKYYFDIGASDKIEYMSPKLVGTEKTSRGKIPTDVWWHTIVHTTGSERLDYPTQKPLGILERIVNVSSRPNDLVLDFFAGTGTTGEACLKLKRNFIMIDDNKQALKIMQKRFRKYEADIVYISD